MRMLAIHAGEVEQIWVKMKELSHEIKPARIQKGIDAPLSVKITRLRNGTALGVQCSHACMDGKSATVGSAS